jgi:hypothetical protein
MDAQFTACARTGYGVLEEVGGRIADMRAAGNAVPPLLLLGVMERVGSNWVSDALRPVTGLHNEPFRQQVSPSHPLSALNPGIIPVRDAQPRLGPYGRHWLVTFAVSKYAPARQVVKETNLFFALPAFLALFPDSPVAVLTRSPLGVASSFERGGLFTRWDYRARYRQMTAITRRTGYRQWAAVVPDDEPPALTALARLQVLNTLILASELHDRGGGLAVVPYETAVLAPGAARAALARLVPEAPDLAVPPGGVPGAADDTFATTAAKTELAAFLREQDAEEVRDAADRAFAAGQPAVPGAAWQMAREWAGGDRLYSLVPPAARTRTAARRAATGAACSCPVGWVPGHAPGPLLWRNLLVTNDEFAAFLTQMAAAGLPNQAGGCYLLACEMPHERGGRLHHDMRKGRWTVSPGFGGHPVYWVTWAGAAAFAACHGARLPSRAEMITETSQPGVAVTNHRYLAGDAVPAAEPGRSSGEIHHLAGNVQVWCGDGPPGPPSAPAQRWLHGAAWNTPGTARELHRPRTRHLSGASRGVGIRLVRDPGHCTGITPAQVAGAVKGWITLLDDRSEPLRQLDEALAGALAGLSQPDRGLRPHVGTGTGETGHG